MGSLEGCSFLESTPESYSQLMLWMSRRRECWIRSTGSTGTLGGGGGVGGGGNTSNCRSDDAILSIVN